MQKRYPDPISVSKRVEFLKGTPLFSTVSDTALTEIAQQLRERTYPAGEVLFREGDTGDQAFIILDGLVRLECKSVELTSRAEGDLVGEFALIDDKPRSASAIAESELRLLVWDRKSFRGLIESDQEVSGGVFRSLLNKLRTDVDSQVEWRKARERWHYELDRARTIHKAMVPNDDVVTNKLTTSSYWSPVTGIGGDYFDYVCLDRDEERVGLVIGDVTGHHFYSSLLVAMAKSCLMTQAVVSGAPRDVMRALSKVLFLPLPTSMLMSCCIVELDAKHGMLKYCNAGHNSPQHYSRKTGCIQALEPTDIVLGVDGSDSQSFSEVQQEWRAGDVLLLYSDGIVEAENSAGEPFGEERLSALLRDNADSLTARCIKDEIITGLTAHCDGHSLKDDVTLVIAKAEMG